MGQQTQNGVRVPWGLVVLVAPQRTMRFRPRCWVMIRAQGPALGLNWSQKVVYQMTGGPVVGMTRRENRGLSRSEDGAGRGRDCYYLFYGLSLMNYLQVVFQLSFSYGIFIYMVCVILVLSN